jgi:Kef-type K+ transport system membrane component KefB
MEQNLAVAAVWMGLALLASLLAIRFRLSVALVEIMVGIVAANVAALLEFLQVGAGAGLHWTGPSTWLDTNHYSWIAFLAGFGSILLTFMAGAEIEPAVLRKFFKESMTIGAAGFFGPFIGAMLFARFVAGWDWYASMICGIALSTTSVAVVYAVMVETGLNETDIGKLILAGCFVNDLGTVIALGVCFANYDWTLALFAVVAAVALWLAPRFVNWFFGHWGAHVSEPGIKLIFFVLFGLGALAMFSRSEAVLPAYMVGLALAGIFAHQRETVRRLRTTVFAFLTPFYFLNAGAKVSAVAVVLGLVWIVLLFLVKVATKIAGVWPLTRVFRFGMREGNYTTLMMSTGLTFGTISALFGLNNGWTDANGVYHSYINPYQYSILVTVVIGSAVIPTMIAQAFFRPKIEPAVALEITPAAAAVPAAKSAAASPPPHRGGANVSDGEAKRGDHVP